MKVGISIVCLAVLFCMAIINTAGASCCLGNALDWIYLQAALGRVELSAEKMDTVADRLDMAADRIEKETSTLETAMQILKDILSEIPIESIVICRKQCEKEYEQKMDSLRKANPNVIYDIPSICKDRCMGKTLLNKGQKKK